MGVEGKRVLFLIAPENFRDEEYAQPRAALYAAGADIATASRSTGYCHGMLGSVAHADTTLRDAVKQDWDLVVFVGGNGADTYFDDADAHALATKQVEAGKPVAAICIAPSTLAHAGVLNGLHATAWPDQEADLVAHGAIWDGTPVAVDTAPSGSVVVTANGPKAAFPFGQQLVGVLSAE